MLVVGIIQLLEERQQEMRTFRFILSWYFLILATFALSVALMLFPREIVHLRGGAIDRVFLAATEFASVVLAFIFGAAWWILRRESDSRMGAGWAVAAGLLNLLISIGIPLFFLCVGNVRGFWELEKLFGIPTAVGVAALFAFPRRREPPAALPVHEHVE